MVVTVKCTRLLEEVEKCSSAVCPILLAIKFLCHALEIGNTIFSRRSEYNAEPFLRHYAMHEYWQIAQTALTLGTKIYYNTVVAVASIFVALAN